MSTTTSFPTESGLELDLLVDQLVMGNQAVYDRFLDNAEFVRTVKCPPYSTEIENAMWVVDEVSMRKVTPHGLAGTIFGFCLERVAQYKWMACFGRHQAEASKPELAICLAAIKAVTQQ